MASVGQALNEAYQHFMSETKRAIPLMNKLDIMVRFNY